MFKNLIKIKIIFLCVFFKNSYITLMCTSVSILNVLVFRLWTNEFRLNVNTQTIIYKHVSQLFFLRWVQCVNSEWGEVWFTWSVSGGDRAVGQLHQGQHGNPHYWCGSHWSKKKKKKIHRKRLGGLLSIVFQWLCPEARVGRGWASNTHLSHLTSSLGCSLVRQSELSRRKREVILLIFRNMRNMEAPILLQTNLLNAHFLC